MIRDAFEKAEIQKEWASVAALINWNRSFAVGAPPVFVNVTPPDTFYNLPLLLAYSTLDHVLVQLIIEGQFVCQNKKGKDCQWLGERMLAAKNAIPWIDYNLVDEGREARNAVAHEAKLSDAKDCIKYISAVQAELKNWNIIA
jgi:hypothetical protein